MKTIFGKCGRGLHHFALPAFSHLFQMRNAFKYQIRLIYCFKEIWLIIRKKGIYMQNQKPLGPLIKSITPKNVLSFGPDTKTIELNSLTVIIGPNGSGKSNLIELINFFRASPYDLREIIRKGGGVREWIWKGEKKSAASIDVVIDNPRGKQPLRHFISFHEENQKFSLEDERIENEHSYYDEERPYFYYSYNKGAPLVKIMDEADRHLAKETVTKDISILAQRRDPENYPVIFHISESYDKIRIGVTQYS